MEKLWTPFFGCFALVFYGIMIVGAAILFCTGGIIVQEIFKTPEQQNALVRIPPQHQSVLEANGIKNCRVRPLQSYTSNQVKVKAKGQILIVFCDPNKSDLSSCCYND